MLPAFTVYQLLTDSHFKRYAPLSLLLLVHLAFLGGFFSIATPARDRYVK